MVLSFLVFPYSLGTGSIWLPTVSEAARGVEHQRKAVAVSRVVAVSAHGSPNIRNDTPDKDDARKPKLRVSSPTLT